MSFFRKHQLSIVTITYWVMLVYMIAALGWWFIALNKQNNAMAELRLHELKKDELTYLEKFSSIEDARKRKTAQYIGEGITFFLLIVVGAAFVYRSVRKQLLISQQQQNFMMAVTHELKTPIAVAQLNLETLQKRKLEESMREKLISNTLMEANRLNLLCNNILLAAQFDESNHSFTFQEIDFSELVHNAVKNFSTRFTNRIIHEQINDHVFILGEQLLLQMLINNLIENALKYSPKEGAITVALQTVGDKIQLSVKDEGDGIADAEKKKIFEKFYRSGQENTRKTKGTGLGLYLCKRIVKRHNGKISVGDNYPKGTIFTVII